MLLLNACITVPATIRNRLSRRVRARKSLRWRHRRTDGHEAQLQQNRSAGGGRGGCTAVGSVWSFKTVNRTGFSGASGVPWGSWSRKLNGPRRDRTCDPLIRYQQRPAK